MLPGDSGAGRLRAGAGRGAVLALLAALFWLGGNTVADVEAVYYDLLQRLTAGPAPAQILLVAADNASREGWDHRHLAELLTALHAADARVILPASPPPPPVGAVEVQRLQSLIDLERRTGQDGGGRRLETLSRQLMAAEESLSGSAAVAAAMRQAGNVVLGLATRSRGVTTATGRSPCEARLEATAAEYAALATAEPEVRAPDPAPAELCLAAAALGHLDRTREMDGVVRRVPLAVTGPGGTTIPAAALAAARLSGWLSAPPPGGSIYTRFYRGPGGGHGFSALTAADVLTGAHRQDISGRVVVIGALGDDPVRTPVGDGLGATVVVGTTLANLIAADHIRRPAWLPVLEFALAAGVGLLAGLVLYTLPVQQAALLALLAAAALLVLQYLSLAMLGVWTHLAALALFCPASIAVLEGLRVLGNAAGKRAGGIPGRAATSNPRPGEELDLAFSVLRQQPTTEQTKLKLYELAMEHGRRRDYARAERVFRHLAGRDPDYRDVAAKLEKLSGARSPAPPRPAPPTATQPAARPAPGAVAPGNRALGRYELERVIGRGAMATVYLGRDPTINRRVAIKTVPLAEEFAESELVTARSHFVREAESSGRLNHPNIIAIHDAGEDNNIAYLAMEYFEGRPLSYYAQLGRLLPPRKVCELMALAADALHYAHGQGVVHRDVKPANLLYDADTDTLKLTDFGIARLTDSNRTRTGIILGTPSYMSPEQLAASRVTGQSDLYSLGVTMYHLLAGSPPFQADSISRLMERIATQPHRPVRDLREDIPPCVDTIIARALAKDPADRFPDGQAMALALRECCSRFPSDLP